MRTVKVVETGDVLQAWRQAKETVCIMIKGALSARNAAEEEIRAECGQEAWLTYVENDLKIDRRGVWWRRRLVSPETESHFYGPISSARELARRLEPLTDAGFWIRLWAREQEE